MPTSAALQTTWRAPPRAMRSVRSAGPTAVVVGMITAPSFITASIDSHSSTWLPSIRTTGSPFRTPRSPSQPASRSEACDISAKLRSVEEPSSSTITRAGRSLSRAIASNQSTAQLNRSPTSGQRNSATARSCCPRSASSWSRLARYASVAPIAYPPTLEKSVSSHAYRTARVSAYGARPAPDQGPAADGEEPADPDSGPDHRQVDIYR